MENCAGRRVPGSGRGKKGKLKKYIVAFELKMIYNPDKIVMNGSYKAHF